MNRVVATLPESVAELCLVRMGIQARGLRAVRDAIRLGRAIDRSSRAATAEDAGLLRSERFVIGWNHFGFLQYWRSFDAMEAWSHRPPHADWWREAADRGRRRGDFGIYHETYLVPNDRLETIYLDCRPVGLGTFGTLNNASGPRTTGRDRLGRRPPQP